MSRTRSKGAPASSRMSSHSGFGAALIAVGVTVNLSSAWRYMRLISQLNRGQFVPRCVSKQGVALATFLALLGMLMAIYLVRVLPPPPDTLHAQSARTSASVCGAA